MYMAITKRYGVPKFWPVQTKAKKYVVSPRPGPHSTMSCIPLGLVLRDVLGYARTMKEAKQILLAGHVTINGVARKDHNFPAGLMDLIDMDGEFYRVVPGKKGLRLIRAPPYEANTRLAKIKNKVHVKKGRIQLNLHDGSNMLIDKDDYKTSDVIVMENNKIKDVIRFEKGTVAVVVSGHNAGAVGTIESIDRNLRTVMLSAGDKKLPVPIRYIFVVGKDKPAVSLDAASVITGE